jgi:stage V sporulation protein B
MVVTLVALTFGAGHDPGRSCTAVVLGSCVGACLTFLCLLVLRLREKVTPSGSVPVARRLIDSAVPLALADDLKAGISTTENLMVPKRLALYPGAANPLALFGVISGMVFPILMFPAAILFGLAELLIPELARCNAAGSKQRIHYLVRRSLRVAMLYGSIFCGLMFLLSEDLCMTLYSNRDAGRYLKWFSLLLPMLYCDAITDAMVKGLGQQKASVRYNILTSLLDVIFLYLLLPKYGIAGYFASFLVTHLINFALSIRRLMKITGQTLPLLTPALCMASIVAGIGPAALLPHSVARSAAYLAILGSLLTISGIVSREDIRWLRSLVYKK